MKEYLKRVEIQMENATYIPIFHRKGDRLSNDLFCVFRMLIFTFVSHLSIIVIRKEVIG